MDEIPLPSSPDSPGPPGEEDMKREEMKDIVGNRESVHPYDVSPPIANSFGETYSPTMVTSSPEYAPGEDQKSIPKEVISQKYKGNSNLKT